MDNKDKNELICPDCQAKILLEDILEKGEVITCQDCSVELEVVNTQPLRVNYAPKVKEDWGE